MCRVVLCVLGATMVLISLLAPTDRYSDRGPVPAAESEPAFPDVNYAVAVDESASLTSADLAAEKAAAARIALGDVSASSQVTLFGFASADAAGQSAVDPLCLSTTLDAVGRETIGECIDKLRGRYPGESTGTDFASAIRQAVADLRPGSGSTPRVLFLLTDGRMDVSDSPQYGDAAHRAAEGGRQLTLALKEAATQGVQIWPLGFGPDPDKSQLDQIAAGGYQKSCVGLPSATPKAHMVSGAKDVGSTLEGIFADARCLRHEEGPSKLPPATLKIDISPLATVGSIVVDKGDPEVKISYIDPNGDKVPASGMYKGSRFEVAGRTGSVEALRIVDPLPGTWKVKAEAPEGHRSLPVTVSALWQGDLRGALSMDPPAPQAGEKVTVTMRLQTHEGYRIKDPGDYEGLRVRGRLSGDGFSPQAINLADDGRAPDAKAGDTSFTGTFTLPKSAKGEWKVGAVLTASGLTAETSSLGGTVAPGELPVTAAVHLPRAVSHPGGKIAASLAVSNNADTPHTLRLSITDLLPGLLSVTPAEIEVRPGERVTREVTIRVAPADVFGDRLGAGLELAGTFTVADVTGYDRTLVQSLLSVPITPEPGSLAGYQGTWFPLALMVALSAVLALAWLRQQRGFKDPSGLQLAQENVAVRSEHMVRHGGNKQRHGWSWVDEPPDRAGDKPLSARQQDVPPPEQPMPRTAAQGTDEGSAEPRWLVAELAEQTSPGREVPLHVQIVRGSARGTGVQLRSFFVPHGGAQVLVTIHAPGLVVLDELQQELHVVPGRDSDVLLFRLKAPMPGPHQVTVRAYRGGTFLGEVLCQISVGEGSVTRDGPQRQAALPSMAFDPGEVTLQVLRDEAAGTISFQLIGETFYPPEIIHFVGDSRRATNQIYDELKRAAKAAAANAGDRDAQRLRARLRNHGVQLWTSAVPQAVQSQFWDEANRVTAFTVLGEHDIIPWELLYPLNGGREDRGFLTEWLPVVRRVHGQDRVRSLSLPGVAFVVPPGSPADTSMEVASLRAQLGADVVDTGVLTERAALTALIEGGHSGLLHFACHNAFTGSGSCVTMADGPFDPIDLASAAQLRTLQPHHPLVFFNACRSAGEIDWFGESLGWAPQFLTAGAGAFVGTLWPVRSRSALQFAETFYDQLITRRQPLGRASLAARQTIRDLHGGDPTWLAYAVYGSPAATAHTTESKE